MACFRIPVAVCYDIERLCAKFWWGDKIDEGKMHWATWKELCKPKSKGGVGFRSLIAFNQALLAKQIWRIIRHPDSLVAKLFKAKYFHDNDIMEVKLSSNASFMWRSMMWGRELLQEGLRWKVGNGQNIRVFSDAWMPTFPRGKFFIPREEMENIRVADLVDENSNWDMDKMNTILLSWEVDEVRRGGNVVEGSKDRRFWKFDARGEYSVKTGYLVASHYFDPPQFNTVNGETKWWKFLWSYDIPQRVRIFSWRLFRGFIPTEMNLLRHHVPVHGRCGSYRKGWGETSHTLMFCEKVRPWWSSFDRWQLLKKWEEYDIGVIGEAMAVELSKDEFTRWLMGMWLVWKGLCDEKHKGQKFNGSSLWQQCDDYINGYFQAKQQAALDSKILLSKGRVKWCSPKKGRYRLDVDYATDEVIGKGGVVAIVRDCKGSIIFALAKSVALSTTVLYGELSALVFGIHQCVEDELSPVEVYTDSLSAVHLLKEENEEESVLGEDMFDFFSVVKKLNVLSICHVRHSVAKLIKRRMNLLA